MLPSQPTNDIEQLDYEDFVSSNLFRLIQTDVPPQFWSKWVSKVMAASDLNHCYPLLVKMFRATNDNLCSIMKSCSISDEPAQYEHQENCGICRLQTSEFQFHGVVTGQQRLVASYFIQNLIDGLQSLNTDKVNPSLKSI